MSTALELGPEGWVEYLDSARKPTKSAGLSPVEKQERLLLISKAKKAAKAIKEKFGAQRVVLFGSLAHEAWYSPQTDVDLAVEGVAADDYWAAWRLAEDIVGDRTVDLVDLETSSVSLRHAIDRHGIEI
ncbi:DNA polymerase beta domain protein region (modular protein) [uncultured Desulfobacterium sp.]|uniref:DNA polymerase beta domain protein region (Modular protein) n=1 Tax=uncultured Desulfobacterium sp. TaxID=201089 RepID=A0A445MYU6_9BACT|nr:DNA polymerase beta domain protein region (modular protein) [uncultured Desulfobacterium sp.]